jgi:hypothetical protein
MIVTKDAKSDLTGDSAKQLETDFEAYVEKGKPSGGKYAMTGGAGNLLVVFATLSTLAVGPNQTVSGSIPTPFAKGTPKKR